MDLQWDRILDIYEKSVDAYGIKSECFAIHTIGTTLVQKLWQRSHAKHESLP